MEIGAPHSETEGEPKPIVNSLEELQQKLLNGEIKNFGIGPPIPGRLPELFVGREKELRQAIELLGNHHSVWVYGDPRSGKSSFLNRLEALMSDGSSQTGTLMFDLQGEGAIFNDKIEEVEKSTRFKLSAIFSQGRHLDDKNKQELYDMILADRVNKQASQNGLEDKTRIVCFVDEVGINNFKYIRDMLTAIKKSIPSASDINFVLVGHHSLEDTLAQAISNHAPLPDWFPDAEIFIEPAIPESVRTKLGIDW